MAAVARLRKRGEHAPNATENRDCVKITQSGIISPDTEREYTQQEFWEEIDYIERYLKSLLLTISRYKQKTGRAQQTK